MKRNPAAVVVLLVTAALSYPPSATAAPPNDSAAGAGKQDATGVSFSFSAHSGPEGEDAKGHYRITGAGAPRDGKVTCFAVVGNRAVVGGERQDAPGQGEFILVEDNGSPGDGVADRANVAVGATADACDSILASDMFLFPITQGNVTVNDALGP